MSHWQLGHGKHAVEALKVKTISNLLRVKIITKQVLKCKSYPTLAVPKYQSKFVLFYGLWVNVGEHKPIRFVSLIT